jgi:hypothetical protein
MYRTFQVRVPSLSGVMCRGKDAGASGRDRPPRQGRAFPLSKFWGRATGASDVLQQRASYLNDVTRSFYRLHLPIDTIAHSKTMTDRATKRLRRLSTEYEDSEDNNEWNNSRYVADVPSTARDSAPSLAPRALPRDTRRQIGVRANSQLQKAPSQANAMTAHHRVVPPVP